MPYTRHDPRAEAMNKYGNTIFVVIGCTCLLMYIMYMIMVLIAYDCIYPTTHPKRLMMYEAGARISHWFVLQWCMPFYWLLQH